MSFPIDMAPSSLWVPGHGVGVGLILVVRSSLLALLCCLGSHLHPDSQGFLCAGVARPKYRVFGVEQIHHLIGAFRVQVSGDISDTQREILARATATVHLVKIRGLGHFLFYQGGGLVLGGYFAIAPNLDAHHAPQRGLDSRVGIVPSVWPCWRVSADSLSARLAVLGALALGMIDGRRRRLQHKPQTFRDFAG